jgi:hydrogenase maturation protease
VSRGPVVHVVCFGNPLHGDDGFGSHVFRHLSELCRLPLAVELFDAGVAGLNALPYFDGCSKAVMVDAVSVGAPLGTVHRLVPADLEPPGGELSLHELGVTSLLAALRAASNHPPELVLIGAQTGQVRTFTSELSPPVRAAVPVAARFVLRECSPVGGTEGSRPGARSSAVRAADS